MIPLDATCTVQHVPLSAILYPTSQHWPDTLDMDAIQHYATLLARHIDQDTDPIMLQPVGDYYTITNGRHRFVAHMVAGRQTVAAVIVRCHDA